MSKILKYLSVLILILFLIISKYHSVFYHYFDWDEAELMSISWAMTQGQVLFKDIPQFHPIFHFFIFYPFFAFFDPDIVPYLIRIFNILYIAGVVYVLMALVYRVFRCYWTSFLAGVMMIFYFGYYSWALSSYGEFYTLLPILYSFLLIVRNTIMNRNTAVFIGILWGIAFFIKQVAVFDAIGGLFVFFVFNKQNSLKKMKNSLNFVYGFLISMLVAFLYPLLHSSVYCSFDSMILSSVISYSTKNSSGFLNAFEILCRFYWILKTVIAQVTNESVFALIGLCFLFFWMGISRVINYEENKEEFSFFWGVVFWFLCVLFGISLIGRYYTHYAIQSLPPFIILFCFLIKRLFKGSRYTLIFFFSFYFMILNFELFKNDLDKNGFYYVPEKVKNSLKIAAVVKELCNPKEQIFLLWHEDLDVFYLSQRLSNNGIYMFLVMDSRHTNHLKTENVRKEIFINNLPKLIIAGNHQPISSCTPIQTFLTKIIAEKYKLIKEIGTTKIYSRI